MGGNSPFLQATTALYSSGNNPFLSKLHFLQQSTKLLGLSDPPLQRGLKWSVLWLRLLNCFPQK